MRVLQIKASGESEVVDIADGLDGLADIYDLVGGEFINNRPVKDKTIFMWFNDTGGPINLVATSIIGAVDDPQNVWGDVVITGGLGPDENIESLEAAPALKIWADRIKEKIVG